MLKFHQGKKTIIYPFSLRHSPTVKLQDCSQLLIGPTMKVHLSDLKATSLTKQNVAHRHSHIVKVNLKWFGQKQCKNKKLQDWLLYFFGKASKTTCIYSRLPRHGLQEPLLLQTLKEDAVLWFLAHHTEPVIVDFKNWYLLFPYQDHCLLFMLGCCGICLPHKDANFAPSRDFALLAPSGAHIIGTFRDPSQSDPIQSTYDAVSGWV